MLLACAADNLLRYLASPLQADIWANTLMAYDQLWLRPQRTLLSDTLIRLQQPAAAAKLVPAGAVQLAADGMFARLSRLTS